MKSITGSQEAGINALLDEDLSPPLGVLPSHGFDTILLGLSEPDIRAGRKDVDHGIQDTQKGLERLARDFPEWKARNENENYPMPLFNLDVSYLAYRDLDKARDAFQQGMKALDAMHAAYESKKAYFDGKVSELANEWQRLESQEEISRDQMLRRVVVGSNFDRKWDDWARIRHTVIRLAAGTISDLHTVQKYCRHLNDSSYCASIDSEIENQNAKLAEEIRVFGEKAPSRSDAHLGRVEPEVSIAGLGWKALDSQLGKHDIVTALWFECEAESAADCDSPYIETDASSKAWKAWRVLPNFSGQTGLSGTPPLRTFHAYSNGYGLPDCMPNRVYGVQIFLNGNEVKPPGNRSEVWAASLKAPPLKAADFREVNLAVCYPVGWNRSRSPIRREASWRAAFPMGTRTIRRRAGCICWRFIRPSWARMTP